MTPELRARCETGCSPHAGFGLTGGSLKQRFEPDSETPRVLPLDLEVTHERLAGT